ncbi:MAG TPA: indolepyruvate ferredoxin oxidoreductase subunit alpha [Burkholderiales bacterium]|jgi:indolepyruvate ferredoxin oxidoreductase alpha subunit|nr:indolepyruvate ferredoxin oxidoreductase subunit alpha [Burkholderiales bacterium]
MERSFKEEVEKLKLGDGETFHGEAILAVTKALLQSGVAYVGGYQGAPVSHVMDVLNDARDILDGLGVHVETNANEAGAAAMLGASINYPMRGAVAFKSTVGTNVASDALSNLASAGVKGGALIVLGEDYGEGASIIQERSHAFAMKSQIWLLDPRPNLPKIVEMVEHGFELSEASSTPVMLELRIRACHVQGSFVTKKNLASKFSKKAFLEAPDFDYGRICLPPATYAQEKHKIDVRWPAAVAYIKENKLNETFPGDMSELGIICQGGMYNASIRALQTLGLADAFGAARVPIYCMNVTYPMVPEEIVDFSRTKKSILIVEEGQPAFIEEQVLATLRRYNVNDVKVRGKDVLPMAGEYTGEVVLAGLSRFFGLETEIGKIKILKSKAADLLTGLPARPPGFCVGCPERPVFSAMKILEGDTGKFHLSADIGCHLFSTLPPFNIGNTVLGYGLGLASNSAVNPMFAKRTVTMMGDGGFWHNGLTSGIANAVFNKNDGILVIMKNGYSSATGTQELPSSPQHSETHAPDMSMERALAGIGADWVRTVDNYRVGEVAKTLKEAMTTDHKGLKVIIAEGECQLERQRKLRPQVAEKLKKGDRHVRVKYGVDEDTCTGDHSCIRLSGCPTLTVKDNPDPLRRDPVATVIDGCVGCGLCGENAHAAVLCPSFYRAEVIQNPGIFDRLVFFLRKIIHGTTVH